VPGYADDKARLQARRPGWGLSCGPRCARRTWCPAP